MQFRYGLALWMCLSAATGASCGDDNASRAVDAGIDGASGDGSAVEDGGSDAYVIIDGSKMIPCGASAYCNESQVCVHPLCIDCIPVASESPSKLPPDMCPAATPYCVDAPTECAGASGSSWPSCDCFTTNPCNTGKVCKLATTTNVSCACPSSGAI